MIATSPQLVTAGSYITVAWDPSPDGLVVGYAVYVGTAPGKYDKVFIVRNQTYFTYPDAVPDQRYYFAVVAYTELLVSNLSQEVSGYGQSTPALPVSGDPIQNSPHALSALNSAGSAICTERGGSGCPDTSIVLSTERSIDALAAIGDSRILIVEDGRHIHVFDGRTLSSEPALDGSPNVTFIGIAADPRPEQRSRIYIAEAERRDDGTRELRIVRYRAVQGRLGEAAVVIAGIHLPETGDAPFTIDAHGRIFIAVPADATDAKSATAAVLGFEADGSALRYNRAASPIVAWAPAAPTAIAWDDSANHLWLAGVDGVAPTVVRVPVSPLTSSDAWPRIPQPATAVLPDRIFKGFSSTRNSRTSPALLLKASPSGGLVRVLRDTNEYAEVPLSMQEETTATSTDPQTKSTYVATRLKFGGGSYIYRMDNW